MDVEIIPAILVKSRDDLLAHITRVEGSVSSVHIDVMDDKFVPNKTISTDSLTNLPGGVSYEFHWMVEKPEVQISQMRGPHLHIVHVEAISNWAAIKSAVQESGGKLGLAISPSTPVESLEPYLKDVSRVLVMSVQPGFYGQKYLVSVEEKIRLLRRKHPNLQIEVDGGINSATAQSASAAGANKFAAASAIYHSGDTSSAVKEIKESALKGRGGPA